LPPPEIWVNDLSTRASHFQSTTHSGICDSAVRDTGDHFSGCLPHRSCTSGRLSPGGACVDAFGDADQLTASPREYPASTESPIERLFTNVAILKETLSEQETLLAALGQATLASATTALGWIRQPAIAIDRFGVVLDVNDEARRLFDCNLYVQNRRLVANDRQASLSLRSLEDSLRGAPEDKPATTEPIIVRRKDKSTVVIRVLPVPPGAQRLLDGAGALLTFSIIEARPLLDQGLLMRIFGLTPAEAKLAALMVEGKSLEAAAKKLTVKRETARNQLKAIFAKTETNRQGQLIALLSSLRSLI